MKPKLPFEGKPPPIKWYKFPEKPEPAVDRERYGFAKQIEEAKKYKFLWLWRFLFTWGWNGEKNTFSVSFYQPDMENEVWSIGDY